MNEDENVRFSNEILSAWIPIVDDIPQKSIFCKSYSKLFERAISFLSWLTCAFNWVIPPFESVSKYTRRSIHTTERRTRVYYHRCYIEWKLCRCAQYRRHSIKCSTNFVQTKLTHCTQFTSLAKNSSKKIRSIFLSVFHKTCKNSDILRATHIRSYTFQLTGSFGMFWRKKRKNHCEIRGNPNAFKQHHQQILLTSD